LPQHVHQQVCRVFSRFIFCITSHRHVTHRVHHLLKYLISSFCNNAFTSATFNLPGFSNVVAGTQQRAKINEELFCRFQS
jgi:hypothetical protein